MAVTYGASFQLGQTFPEDGIFFRVTTEAPPPAGVVPFGIAAVAFRSSWGPLGTPTLLDTIIDLDTVFGSDGTTALVREAFNGGALQVIGYRLGSGGATASFNIMGSGGALLVLTVPLAYPGSRGSHFSYMLRDSVLDPTKREFDLFEGSTLRATILFAKAPTTVGGAGEAGALQRAILASGSPWFGTPVLPVPAPGDTTLLATVNVQTPPTTPGTDPPVTGTDYTAMMQALTMVAFNTLAVDTIDMATLSSLATYAMQQEQAGKRFLVPLTEPTTVPRATRMADARAFNNYRVVYLGNSYVSLDGGSKDGPPGAAQLAGRVASTPIGQGLTGLPVIGGTSVIDPFNLTDYRSAILGGMLVTQTNEQGQVVWGEGTTTYLTPDSDHTPSYQLIAVVRTYDYLQDAIYVAWNPLLRRRTNNPRTRRLLLAAANNVIAQLVGSEALLNATIIEDPANPPQGRRAWFRLGANAAQPLEQAYVTLLVDFVPATA